MLITFLCKFKVIALILILLASTNVSAQQAPQNFKEPKVLDQRQEQLLHRPGHLSVDAQIPGPGQMLTHNPPPPAIQIGRLESTRIDLLEKKIELLEKRLIELESRRE